MHTQNNPELAALICHYVNSNPTLFAGCVTPRIRPDIVTWSDEIRPATAEEADRLANNIPTGRLEELLLRPRSGGEENLLFPLVLSDAGLVETKTGTTTELLLKSLKRLHTSFSHKFVSSWSNTWTSAPVYCVKIHGDSVFSGADDWIIREFKINRLPKTPDEPILKLHKSFYGHTSVITDFIVFSFGSSTFLCSCSPDCKVRVYRVGKEDAVFAFYLTFDADVPYVAESGGRLIACSEIGELVVIPGESLVDSSSHTPGGLFRGRGLKRVFASASRHSQVRGFAVNGNSVYLALTDKTIKIYNIETCNPHFCIDLHRVHSKPVSELCTGTVQHWNPTTKRCMSEDLLVSSDDHGNLVLWKATSPYQLLSTSHGALCLSDQSQLASRLARLEGRSGDRDVFFTVDVTVFMANPAMLLASMSVYADRAREAFLFPIVLMFETSTGELVDIIESFSERIFVLKPIKNTDCILIAGYDGDLALFRYASTSRKLVEVNRFSIATPNRVVRKVLDAWVEPKFSRPRGNQAPRLIDLTIACSDSFGSVSLFGVSEICPLQGLEEDEVQKFRDAFSHQFFVSDYVGESDTQVQINAQICDFRGRAGRIHHYPEDPLPSVGSGYDLRAKPGVLPSPPNQSLPSIRIFASDERIEESVPGDLFADMIDAGDVTDSSDTSFSNSVRLTGTRSRARNMVASDTEEEGRSESGSDGTSLVDEQSSSSSSSALSPPRLGRRVPTRSRSILGIFYSPVPSPPRRSTRVRPNIRYSIGDNTSDASVESSDPGLIETVEMSGLDAAPLTEDLWLACDTCDKWRRVSRECFDEYNGTDKVVRCRRIGRNCNEPDDNAELHQAQPPVLVPEPTPIAPQPMANVDEPRTATGITLRRRLRNSSPVREPSPEPVSVTADLARLRQDRAERRQRLREGGVARAGHSHAGRVLRRRGRSELTSDDSQSSASAEASPRPRQPRRIVRRTEHGRNLRPRRN